MGGKPKVEGLEELTRPLEVLTPMVGGLTPNHWGFHPQSLGVVDLF